MPVVYFELGETYTRDQISIMLATKDANIRNGVFKPKGKDFLILFVTEEKTKDRTPYRDRLEGMTLTWEGQSSGRTDKWIIEHEALGLDLFLFYRKNRRERDDYSFVYLGRVSYLEHTGSHPTQFRLKLTELEGTSNPLEDRERVSSAIMMGREGERLESLVKTYQRNRYLRQKAIEIKGARCGVCGFSFPDVYGDLGRGFAEVHHIVPLSVVGKECLTNPEVDLIVLCSNCHSMIHRKTPALSPDQLLDAINSLKSYPSPSDVRKSDY